MSTSTRQFSMRVEEKATAEAERATGTRRLAPVPRLGTMMAKGVSYLEGGVMVVIWGDSTCKLTCTYWGVVIWGDGGDLGCKT